MKHSSFPGEDECHSLNFFVDCTILLFVYLVYELQKG